MLLIDYLEDSAEYLKEKNQALKNLEEQYRHLYDRDLKREIALIKTEIQKKKSEISNQLLLNLDEFRYLHKYFPELLATFMEDEHIGKFLSKKAWLLNYKPLPPAEAAAKLEEIKALRAQLKDAKKFIKKWVGSVDSKAFAATFPALKGRIKGRIEKEEVVHALEDADRELIREGWLLLITDSLIKIPLAKFSNKLVHLNYEEAMSYAKLQQSKEKGTVAEANALRKYEKAKRKRMHCENVITQLLLANPNYLRSLKKKSQWLSREKTGTLEKIAKDITPHTVKERTWLNEMNKKLFIEEEPPKKKRKKKS